ncbi:MAG TPA: hypothetical protein VFG69_00600 [Nannocystaceae bacterium]|nr:hypothetical protein [Nannocystaceae bacterium]
MSASSQVARSVACAVALVACGPGTVVDAGVESSTSADESTSFADSSSGGGSVAADSSSSDGGDGSTGNPAPGCEDPGECDASCLQWELIRERGTGVRIEQVGITPTGTILAVERREMDGEESGGIVLLGFEPGGADLVRASRRRRRARDGVVTGLDVAADGKIAIVWTENPSGVYEFRTTLDVRDADGSPLWNAQLGDGATSVAGTAVVFADDGTIIVVGDQPTAPATRIGFATAFGADGGLAWELVGADLDLEAGRVTAIAAMSATDLVLAGSTGGGLWLGRVGLDTAEPEDALSSHHARDIEMSIDGEIIVVGTEGDGPGYPASWLGRFGTDGSPLLSIAFEKEGEGSNELDSIEVTDEGRSFVAGLRSSVGGSYYRQVLEVDCEANLAWQWLHDGAAPSYNVSGGGLALGSRRRARDRWRGISHRCAAGIPRLVHAVSATILQ